MIEIAFRIENLSKQYKIGALHRRHDTLRDQLMAVAKTSFRPKHRVLDNGETIWALKDISFEVKQGEALGIIGRNGAGKSTLLKILSRITKPTTGCATIHGRVGSLLEVGTGFHGELTGRENVYLNGAILGMSRAEIKSRFNEIVEFAEVEKFIDTPVKRYSSGMYMRLAFAVAAHLEPEILIVDEVLAVGDAAFQKKCLGKMGESTTKGRTILFVSHNMQAISRLCSRVILLDKGALIEDGLPHQVINRYTRASQGMSGLREWPDLADAPGDNVVRLRKVCVRTEKGDIVSTIGIHEPVTIEIEYDVLKPGLSLSPVIICYNQEGLCVFSSSDLSPQSIHAEYQKSIGHRITCCNIPGNLLAEGEFTFSVSINAVLNSNYPHVAEQNVVSFTTTDIVTENSQTVRGLYDGPILGVVRPMLKWTTRVLSEETACH